MSLMFDLRDLGPALDEHALVSVADAAGNIIFANQKFVDISGYNLSELIGKNHRILKSGIHIPSFYRHMWETLLSGCTWQGEVCNRSKSGDLYWVKTTIKPILDINGLPIKYISIRTPINRTRQKDIAANFDENGPLTILLVEDMKSQAILMTSLLGKFGHTVHHSLTGEEAIESFRLIKPDLVLMDITLPGIDGYEATKAIRAEHKEWVPIIFLSGYQNVADKLRALEVGGDDFFSKPVNHDELVAKLKVMGRIHAMQHKLNRYMVDHEQNDEIAATVMNRYLSASHEDPRVEYSILSATNYFSGDAISVARTPDGSLNVMVLDAMGHGLPAAINVLPAIQSFYALSKKGVKIEDLVSELNNIVCEFSPTGHFLAATLLNLDATASRLSGWIGGSPDLFISSEGEIQRYGSKNFSLGVLPSGNNQFEFFNAPWSEKSMLITCTDGVIESRGKDGEDLGDTWIFNIVQQYGNSLDKTLFNKLWKESLGANTPHDDASVLIIKQSASLNS
jgi:PAS domain S-box-containing protein